MLPDEFLWQEKAKLDKKHALIASTALWTMRTILALLFAIAIAMFADVELGHAQFSPPFNASSVATLGAPCTSQGSILFQSANGLSKCLGAGVSGQVVRSGGPGADIAWQTVPGTGTVTSVAATVPAYMAVTGSPVTTSGTLAFSFGTEANNTVFAGPTTGGPLAPSWRVLALSDLPTGYPAANLGGTVSLTTQVAGTLPVPNGGTGVTAFGFGNILTGRVGGPLASVTSVATGAILASQGVGADPAYKTPSGDVSFNGSTGAFTVSSINGNPLGVAANNVVQLNGSSQLPAVSGALLTNLPATTGTLVNIQFLTAASGTYTPTAGTTRAIELLEGSGAGGGGASSASTAGGAGGGSGGLLINFDNAPASTSYANGAAGTAGISSGGNGGNGNATTFGTLSAPGGLGGSGSNAAAGVVGGAGGTSFTGGTATFAGNSGASTGSVNAASVGATGAPSFWGGGGIGGTNTAGGAATACGAGGGGGGGQGGTNKAGGAGFAGCILVLEYK